MRHRCPDCGNIVISSVYIYNNQLGMLYCPDCGNKKFILQNKKQGNTLHYAEVLEKTEGGEMNKKNTKKLIEDIVCNTLQGDSVAKDFRDLVHHNGTEIAMLKDRLKIIEYKICEHNETTLKYDYKNDIELIICADCGGVMKKVHNKKERLEYYKDKYETKLKKINEQLAELEEKWIKN